MYVFRVTCFHHGVTIMLIPMARISTRLIAVPIFVTRRWFSIHPSPFLTRLRTLARTLANAISDPRSRALHWAPAGTPVFAWAAASGRPGALAVARLAAAPVAAAGMDSSWGRATECRPDRTTADPGCR